MNAFQLADRFRGQIHERPGAAHHPLIQWWHSLCDLGFDQPDEIPWCSSFVNGVCWILDLPRSKSAAARSWLRIGTETTLDEVTLGYCVVVLRRRVNGIDNGVSGHVGFYAGHTATHVAILGGNQSNQVTVAMFPIGDVLGIRRLKW